MEILGLPAWLVMVIGLIVGTILPIVWTKYLPNKKFHDWGFKAGQKFSAGGRKFSGSDWEKFENNVTGSFISFTKGFEEGADSDD